MYKESLLIDLFIKNNKKNVYLNDIYRMVKKNENYTKTNKYRFPRLSIYLLLNMFFSSVLLISNMIFQHRLDFNKDIAIARVPRTRDRICKVYGKIQFIEDDVKNGDFTIYRIGSRKERLKFLLGPYFERCCKSLKEIKNILNYLDLEPYKKRNIINNFLKRIPHTVIYENAVESIMLNYELDTIYTGQMYDRFALIEDKLAKKYNKKLVCIPHGVESTEKMPVGYAGDLFYCSSPEMALKLNNLYETEKFKFDNDITKNMYCLKKVDKKIPYMKEKKVVFFTQPINTECTKKIINTISRYLESRGQKLYIKVHPLEKKTNYKIKNAEYIDKFEDAIVENICISFASTSLIEAIYNDSHSVSVVHLINNILNLTGNNEFLNDKRIFKPKAEEDLFKLIDDFL